jgi:Flp pilus assembly pilin Flp
MKEQLELMWLQLTSDEKGVTTVEYAVMLFLVAIAVLLFGQGIANSVTGVFSQISSNLGGS